MNMNSKKFTRFLALALGCLTVFTGCAGANPNAETSNSGSQASESSNEPIRIGALGALSGASAILGKQQQQGIELALKEINADGGILGRQVEVFFRDDEADPTKCKTAAEELIDKVGVDFIIGPTNSTPAAAAIPYLQESKIINLMCIASSDSIIDAEKFPYAFRIMIPNGLQAQALVMNAKERGYEKVALVGDNSALGVDGIAAMEKWCNEYGIEPVATVTYKAEDADMTPVAQALKDAGADCGLFWTLGADGAKIVRAIERIGYTENMNIYGYTGMVMPNFKELAGPGADRCSSLSVAEWAVEAGGELDGRFLELYNKIIAEYGEYGVGKRDTNPSTVASGYDCMMMLKWAIEKAGSTDSDAVKEVIETYGSEYVPFFGSSYKFSAEDHDGYLASDVVPVAIGEMQNGDLYIKN